MTAQTDNNFERIAAAIAFIRNNFRQQPTLEDVAAEIHLSSFHFQRIFTEWAGVSPKKFLQFITVEHARKLLKETGASLFDAATETGLSGTSRLHDLFISIEGMTPGEYKNGGANLTIHYSYAPTPFGDTIIASTPKGICHLAFADNHQDALLKLQACFPNAAFRLATDQNQQHALQIFSQDWSRMENIKLHLKGTEFQLKVWETLLKIPTGRLATYSQIAGQIQKPKASRAAGSAIGDNPVAYLIPCHRVIQSGGEFGQYHWGSTRKTAIIGWEAARVPELQD
ncbi:methylated-DNA--[protein]-cysteine S-methyltransferase [Flavihumibacter stibioxidans]|uniref:Cysteine methyltransferase n=1 Tax=Flavihumibacter stibioxidans TaxID=1834163 RepID=A0ABR7M649_9BACT|nr:methylated-DNA--[protein]-cysteine S-methyltransferase [Flavihumibacter stibioxidans]MBC6490462.1 cysteine methyltransferase [Flavihumibacter stibioxidans]